MGDLKSSLVSPQVRVKQSEDYMVNEGKKMKSKLVR
jgi:hypothetical protein